MIELTRLTGIFLHLLMHQMFEKKNCTIVLLTLELVGNYIFAWRSAIGHPHMAFEIVLKNMYLRREKIQNSFAIPQNIG